MINKVKEQIEIKNALEKELIDYFKNKDILVQDRWNTFKLAVENNIFVKVNHCYWNNKVIEIKLKLEWYDDFDIERYEEVTFPDVIERILEMDELELEEDSYDILRIKEDMLQSGYSGFRMDW